jgi:DNA primase
MQDSTKYLIHADVRTDGVVERSDVVGAVFGQTEGLLGDDLDLRDLQQSSKVGRIDVDIRSKNGQSFGEVAIATGLEKVETAILAAALETIDRVGPSRSEFEVTGLEDVRAAKRRSVVERATELLSTLEADVMSSADLVEEVQKRVRVEDITEYEGLPAGPRVTDSDAIVLVEGRADVLQLLRYGIKNAVAVEGTSVPDAVSSLTHDRTVTAFLDGDRGGDLILKELQQVADVDYVAFAPAGRSVEDLGREAILSALREKVPVEVVADVSAPHETVAATDGSSRPAPPEAMEPPPEDHGDTDAPETVESATGQVESTTGQVESTTGQAESATGQAESATETAALGGSTAGRENEDVSRAGETTDAHDDQDDESPTGHADQPTPAQDGDSPTGPPEEPETLAGYVHAVIGEDTGEVVLLDSGYGRLAGAPAADAFEAIAECERVPATVVLDGTLNQRVLDVAAQRGVEQVVARETGQFVKRPTSVRVRTADQLEVSTDP